MVNGSIVSIFDRLSVKTVLTKSTGSYLGFLATLGYIAVCLILLIPAIYVYHNGVYFQSQFIVDQLPSKTYYTGQDLIMAISFRNRITNEYANHTDIKQKIVTIGAYYSPSYTVYKTQLDNCRPQIFKNAINPIQVKDCLMLPFDLQYNIIPVLGYFAFLQFGFTARCQNFFKCGLGTQLRNQTIEQIYKLNQKYYYDVIFTSRVLDEKGNPTYQFHKFYSSQYNSPDSNNQISVIKGIQMKTYVDNSIMPWWNNFTLQGPYWIGNVGGKDISDAGAATMGFYVDYYIYQQVNYAYRYYKKLDFLLGTIGGTVFLLFLIFWVPINFLNRTLQKIYNSQSLFIDSDYYNEDSNNNKKIINATIFKRIQINIIKYLFFSIIPGKTKEQDLISLGQHQIDIIKMIKRLKVTKRNLKVKNIPLKLNSKDLQYQSQLALQQRKQKEVNVLDLDPQISQILQKAQNSQNLFSTNLTALALLQSKSTQQIIRNDSHQKNRIHLQSSKFVEKIKNNLIKIIKYFDIFGARPMFVAQPQNSSFFGLFLTIIIIILSILTFALTIVNMNNTKVMTNNIYQKPQDHNYQMTTGQNLRFSFCIPGDNLNKYFVGPNKIVQLTMFKYSQQEGYQQIPNQRMILDQDLTYYQTATHDNMAAITDAKKCFRPVDGVKVKMGGTYNTQNQAYFGVRLDPYCAGTPSQCLLNRNTTIKSFLKVINGFGYNFRMNQNKYQPTKGRIVPGIALGTLSQLESYMNANNKRTQTYYVYATELIQDKSQSFLRQEPKSVFKAASYYNGGFRNQQRKSDIKSDPAYILEIRPNGQVKQVILRSYKIDYLFGIIGGVFLFWYFVIHFFAKIYNSYKVRAKLAEVLYQQNVSSFRAQLIYLLRIPSKILCCSSLSQNVQRMKIVDQKIKRDLNYLNILKKVNNTYYLSCSLFQTNQQKNLAAIYFRQKIYHSQQVQKRKQQPLQNQSINQRQRQNGMQNQSFFSLQDQLQSPPKRQKNKILNQTILSQQKINQNQQIQQEKDITQKQKIKKQVQPLYNWNDRVQKQSTISQMIKYLDLFKNQPQYTLDGRRDVKSIFGGICFFVIFVLIVIVCSHFVGLYLSGSDYTISYRRFRDQNLNKLDKSNTFNEKANGINLKTGQNFKFVLGFFKRQHFYPHNVSNQIGTAIGVRAMQYKIKRINNSYYNQTFVQTQFVPCSDNYLNGFVSQYNDPDIYSNLTYAYCLPDNTQLTINGVPQDDQTNYFKVSVYNKFKNSTGKDALNAFFMSYSVIYYTSVPILNYQFDKIDYQMYQYTTYNGPSNVGREYNFTFTKTVFTNKYARKSIETYGDKMWKSQNRLDFNTLSNQSTRNVSFTYRGVIQQYTLDYPQGGELFGLVGGVIAMFTFIIYSFVSSFNQYRMKYLIGQRLYSFYLKQNEDQKKNKKNKNKNKQRLTYDQKLKKDKQQLKRINNYNQFKIFISWILNPLGYIKNDYNFNDDLRRITLIIQKVQNDLNLYNFYLTLQAASDALNKKILLESANSTYFNIKLTQIYFKKFYHPYNQRDSNPTVNRLLKNISDNNKLSNYEIINIQKAINAKINPQNILNNKILNKLFKQGTNIDQSQNQIYQQNVSQINNDNNNKNKQSLKMRFSQSSNTKLIESNKNQIIKKSDTSLNNFDQFQEQIDQTQKKQIKNQFSINQDFQ